MATFVISVPCLRAVSHSVIVCYAHDDNSAANPQLRWLDRLLEFVEPLKRNGDLATWSDEEIRPGESWHPLIQRELYAAKIAVLLVSPAFLASDYIAHSEVPVVLKLARDRGLKILPVIISPCLFEETRFKFPDWKTGPDELLRGSLQSINPPSRTLIEMNEGEQNRVFLSVAPEIVKRHKEERASPEQGLRKRVQQLKTEVPRGSRKRPPS